MAAVAKVSALQTQSLTGNSLTGRPRLSVSVYLAYRDVPSNATPVTVKLFVTLKKACSLTW